MKRLIFLLALIALFAPAAAAQRRTENVILVTLDGARHQEIFGGLDAALYRKIDEAAEKNPAFQKFDAATPEARRERLMPFFWRVLMKEHGSIAGNRALGSAVETTNNLLFSYPGYSEMLTGEARDELIKSNDRVQNRFPSFLQFLQKKMRLDRNGAAVFASWEVMNEIVTSDPNALLVNAGYEEYRSDDREMRRLSLMQFETPTPWRSERHDYYTFRFALDHLQKHRPRVLHLSFIETDAWGHGRRYDMVLDALHRTDGYLRELWQFLQTDKQYRGKTTVIVTTDHGRGATEKDWMSHNARIAEARRLWLAVASPDSSLRGEWRDTETVYQNQIAATACKFLGFDYAEQNPNAGRPIEKLFKK